VAGLDLEDSVPENRKHQRMAKFEKGQSGNPGGRPKEIGEVRDLARAQTAASIDALVSIRDNAKAPAAARVTAATALLDRAWGKPTTTIAADSESPLVPVLNVSVRQDLEKLDRTQRDQLREVLRTIHGSEASNP
jgi:hypothetical protein